jgi:hypothetical protein
VDLLQLAVKNGTALRADALSIYLEKCHKEFSSKIFAALYRDGSSVTAKALENYVLYCADAPGAKAANALALEACADLADETADTIRELEQETSPRIQQQLREAIDRKVSEMIRLLESVRPG